MTHWGWYWKVKKKHIARTIIDSSLSPLDSFKIFKNAIVGFMVEPWNIRVELVSDYLHLWHGKSTKPSYVIRVEKQPCHFGGFRTFFHCPLCQKRMRILYFVQKSIFSCRKCLNLCYKTQRLRPSRRYIHTEKKIDHLLESKGGNKYIKPPHMHITTYERLLSKQQYYDGKWHQAYTNDLREWFGSKIEEYIDDSFDYADESKPWRKVKPRATTAVN